MNATINTSICLNAITKREINNERDTEKVVA